MSYFQTLPWDKLRRGQRYLHAFEEPEKDLEPLKELRTQLRSPHCGLTDQNVPDEKGNTHLHTINPKHDQQPKPLKR